MTDYAVASLRMSPGVVDVVGEGPGALDVARRCLYLVELHRELFGGARPEMFDYLSRGNRVCSKDGEKMYKR